MKHYELYDYLERKYKNLPAIQIIDEMPLEGLLSILEPSELILHYQQKYRGLWNRYIACRQITDTFVNPDYITRLLRNMTLTLKNCMKVRLLIDQKGGRCES
jgi:hypothetical protein